MDVDQISDTKVHLLKISRFENFQNFDFSKIDAGRDHNAPTASGYPETRFRAPPRSLFHPVTWRSSAGTVWVMDFEGLSVTKCQVNGF